VALVDDGVVLSARHVEAKSVHAEMLLPLVNDLLKEGGISLENLDAIAISAGPGSFTGLRIGMSLAKGLAFASDIPLVAVPTLQALALKAAVGGQVTDWEDIVPVLDARRDEVYYQRFSATEETVAPLQEPGDAKIADLLVAICSRGVVVTGEAAEKVRAVAAGHPGASTMRFLERPWTLCDAATVANIGERLFLEGKTVDAATLEPRYIKNFFLRTSP
jgi:tRNA threonylcarbamoyladenosine biosynthesis protein TsaB